MSHTKNEITKMKFCLTIFSTFISFFSTGSILGRIVRITDDVIEYRAWIEKTFPVKSSIDNKNENDSLSSHSLSSSEHSESPYTVSESVSLPV